MKTMRDPNRRSFWNDGHDTAVDVLTSQGGSVVVGTSDGEDVTLSGDAAIRLGHELVRRGKAAVEEKEHS
jgi:hypothetical protein